MEANLQPRGYQQKKFCEICDNSPWSGWISVGLRSMRFKSPYCEEHLIMKNKQDWFIINAYLNEYSNAGFSIWDSIARVTMARDLHFDPRADYMKLSDLEFGKIEGRKTSDEIWDGLRE